MPDFINWPVAADAAREAAACAESALRAGHRLYRGSQELVRLGTQVGPELANLPTLLWQTCGADKRKAWAGWMKNVKIAVWLVVRARTTHAPPTHRERTAHV